MVAGSKSGGCCMKSLEDFFDACCQVGTGGGTYHNQLACVQAVWLVRGVLSAAKSGDVVISSRHHANHSQGMWYLHCTVERDGVVQGDFAVDQCQRNGKDGKP